MSKKTSAFHGMRAFYVIWFGQLVSTLGSGLTGFALGVWIYENTSSVTLFAVNTFAYMATTVLVSPFAGALVDRLNRRLVMILSDAGAGLSTLAIWLLILTGKMEIWHIYIVTVFNAAFTAFQFPAHSAATTMLVPKEQLGRAGGMVQIGQAISQLFSPALAGALFVSAGLETIVMIDFVTFIVAVLTLLTVRIPEPERTAAAKDERGSLLSDINYGWRYIVDRKGLLYWMLYIAGLNFSFGIFNTLLSPLMLELGDAQQAGFVASIIGAGMLIGTLIMSVWGGPKRRFFAVAASGFWMGLCVLAMGAQPSMTLIGIVGFFMMLALPILNGNSRAMWQTKVPADVQGRVFSVRRVIGQFTYPISALIAGPLVDNLLQPAMNEGGSLADSMGRIIGVGSGRGTALAFVLVGLAMLVLTVAAFSNTRLRRAEIEIPDAEVRVREEVTGTGG
jgi:MFS family permease